MRKICVMSIAVLLLFCGAALGADKELDGFLKSLNVQAEADFGGFKAKLSTQFNIPLAQVEILVKTVEKPADAYMCLRVGEIAKKPTELVVKEYNANKGKGWGVIAKNLGIKPGSKEFHDLKKGDFSSDGGKDKEKGKGKGKGKGKDK